MPQFWKITTSTDFTHGSDILDKPAKITFFINDGKGGRLDGQPTGKILAWHTSNSITFETNYILSPFLNAHWDVGQIDIKVDNNTVISKQFYPGGLS